MTLKRFVDLELQGDRRTATMANETMTDALQLGNGELAVDHDQDKLV